MSTKPATTDRTEPMISWDGILLLLGWLSVGAGFLSVAGKHLGALADDLRSLKGPKASPATNPSED